MATDWPFGATSEPLASETCRDDGLEPHEYDAHPCAATELGNDAVSRAQAHAGKATMPPRRTAAVLKPALADADQQRLDPHTGLALESLRPAAQDLDDLEQRVKLLEPKP